MFGTFFKPPGIMTATDMTLLVFYMCSICNMRNVVCLYSLQHIFNLSFVFCTLFIQFNFRLHSNANKVNLSILTSSCRHRWGYDL